MSFGFTYKVFHGFLLFQDAKNFNNVYNVPPFSYVLLNSFKKNSVFNFFLRKTS